MRAVVAASVVPVGWAPLSEALANVVDHKFRYMSEELAHGPVGSWMPIWLARMPASSNPAAFVGLVEWADKVLTE
jgi:hypothetical protein